MVQIIEKQTFTKTNTPALIAMAINNLREQGGLPRATNLEKMGVTRLLDRYHNEYAEYSRAVVFGTKMAEAILDDASSYYAGKLAEMNAEIMRLKEKNIMAKATTKKNDKKKETKPAEAKAETKPVEAEVDPEPEPEPAGMTDKRALEVLFKTVLSDEDFAKAGIEDMTDEQCAAELKENVTLLVPEDKPKVMAEFPEDGEAAWEVFVGLKADLSAEKVKENKKAEKKASKEKEKSTAAPKEQKEKKAGRPGGPNADAEKDEFGFVVGSKRSMFAAELKKGPKTMTEIAKCEWNDGKMSFGKTFKVMEEKGFATKDKDGKMAIIKKK